MQEREFERLGSNVTRHIDVRVVAATNQDLRAALEQGTFREDLYYRLNVVPINIPPLRERKQDIPFLANHFLHKLAPDSGSQVESITDAAMEKLHRLPLAGQRAGTGKRDRAQPGDVHRPATRRGRYQAGKRPAPARRKAIPISCPRE